MILIIKISEIPGRLFYELPFFSFMTEMLFTRIKGNYRIYQPRCHRAKMAVLHGFSQQFPFGATTLLLQRILNLEREKLS